MDPKFHERVVRELAQLLEAERNGTDPKNRRLRNAVYLELRAQEAAETVS